MWPEAWWSIMQYLFLVLQNNTKVTIYVYYNGNLAFIIILLGFIWKYGVFSTVVITPKTSDIKYLANALWLNVIMTLFFRFISCAVPFYLVKLSWVVWSGDEFCIDLSVVVDCIPLWLIVLYCIANRIDWSLFIRKASDVLFSGLYQTICWNWIGYLYLVDWPPLNWN